MGNEYYNPAEDVSEPDLTEEEIEEVRRYAWTIGNLSMAHKIVRLADMVTELQRDLAEAEADVEIYRAKAMKWQHFTDLLKSEA